MANFTCCVFDAPIRLKKVVTSIKNLDFTPTKTHRLILLASHAHRQISHSCTSNSSTSSTATTCKPAKSNTMSDKNHCAIYRDLLSTAESIEEVAMGLAYGFFDVVVFRCPIHREKVTIASQKPQFFCNENSSTDFTGLTKNLTRSISPPVKIDDLSNVTC